MPQVVAISHCGGILPQPPAAIYITNKDGKPAIIINIDDENQPAIRIFDKEGNEKPNGLIPQN